MNYDLQLPIQRMKWIDAMNDYGSDKPDTRFDMKLIDVTENVKNCGFGVFANAVKEFLKEIGVLSYILMRFNDRNGNECFLIISSLGKYVQWNELHFKYYRAFTDLLSYIKLD